VHVTGLAGVTAISTGITGNHNLALKDDGTVVAWGANFTGQLGDGTFTNRSAPVAVDRLSGVVMVAASGSHSLALMSDGSLEAWGNNNVGQLGTAACQPIPPAQQCGVSTPQTVPGVGDVLNIAAGDSHNLALLPPITLIVQRYDATPTSQSVNVPQHVSKVQVQNGRPGLTNLRLEVNTHVFEVAGLDDGGVRQVDLASAMQPGFNTITLSGLGKPGGRATVTISD